MSWVAAAIAGATAITGAVVGNQTKQRNKGYIEQNRQVAQQRLSLKQRAGRQDAAESLGARGLTSGGDVMASPIKTAMVNGQMVAQGDTPHTVGAQQTSDNAVQMGLEQQDLNNQVTQADRENQAQYTNTLIGAGLSGLQAGATAYGAKQELGAMNGGSPIKAAMQPSQVGIDNPGNWYGGVHGLDPLNAPGSSWNTGTGKNSTNLGTGQSNASFNVG